MNFFYEQKDNFPSDIRILAHEFKLPDYPAHWHNEIEIKIVKKGAICFGFNLESYILDAGDILLIPSGNIHYTNNENYGRALVLLFSPNLLDGDSEGFSVPLILKKEYGTDFFIDIYNNIETELNNTDTAYKRYVKHYLGLLSSWIIRKRRDADIIKNMSVKSNSLICAQKLIEYIESNYDKPLTLDMGANIMHLSKSRFCNYFKELTGVTFVRYINRIRIQAAKNMLRTTNLNITEIAFKCGFGNMRTFNHDFKNMTGVNPTEYRNTITP